jgi:hypothetical protein
VSRAGEELPAKAASLALRLLLVPHAVRVTDCLLVSARLPPAAPPQDIISMLYVAGAVAVSLPPEAMVRSWPAQEREAHQAATGARARPVPSSGGLSDHAVPWSRQRPTGNTETACPSLGRVVRASVPQVQGAHGSQNVRQR